MKIKIIIASLIILLLPLSLLGQINPEDINDWRGKTILWFGAHPDDEGGSMGTFAKLTANGNKIYIVLYTTGNRGSRDLDMTSEKLAQIRKKEDEEAMKTLGIPAENMFWLGYDDGMLEYVPEKELCEKVCWFVRKYRPDAVFSFDPGSTWMKWHKTDHRMSAFISLDGARAAAYHLYFPHHRIYENLQPHTVRDYFFYGSVEPNYKVDIMDVIELKIEASCKYTSQFGSGNLKYIGPEMLPEDKENIRKRRMRRDPDGRIYARFRRLQESMSF
ncbi:PIG-L deacetylase family protein [candidate division KSB1 bacterium]